MKQISQIKLLENGYQASFADGTAQFYRELIAVDFDGESNASYTNAQLDFALTGFDVKAAVSAEDQAAILEKLNAEAADGVLYINADQAASLPKSSYSTVFVGDTDAFAKLGNFAGIAETTGAFAVATTGDNAFVLTGSDFTADSLASTIAHEAGHLMGTVEHDYDNDGVTLDDFGTAWPTGRINQTNNINTSYEGVKTGRAATGVDGAAVRFAGGTMTIGKAGTVTTLNNNSARWGGAISVDTDNGGTFTATSKLTIQNTTFSQNKSTTGGGAINVSNGYSNANVILEVSGCTFSANTTAASDGIGYGSAIFADLNSAKITITDSVFLKNKAAASNGGAIALHNSTATVTGCTFSGNTNGAINLGAWETSSASPKMTVTDCKFTSSSDKVYVKCGTLTLNGTNTFAADVTKASNGTINGADNATYIFQQNTGTNFQVTNLGTGSSVIFDGCQAPVAFTIGGTNSFSPAKTTVNTSKGIVGNIVNIGSGVTWLAGEDTVTMNGKSVNVGTDSKSALYVTTDNKLYAKTLFAGRAMSAKTGTDSIEFVSGSTYTEDFGTVTLGGDKDVIGNGAANTRLKGTIYADGKVLNMSKLTYTGVIYGANATGSTETSSSLKFDNVTFDSSTSTSRIYGGGKVAAGDTLDLGTVEVILGGTGTVDLGTKTSVYGAGYAKGANSRLGTGDIVLDINAETSQGTTSGSIYGGAYVSVADAEQATVQLGNVTTTIKGGHFKFAGNGSYVSSTASASSIMQGDSTLNISGGIFEGCVYAGGYSRGANTAEVDGDSTLNISGGTFRDYIYGGCAANLSSEANKTTITGNISVTIDGGTANAISFGKSLFAGSMGNGVYTGDTTVTLKGNLSNIAWAKDAALYGSNQWARADQSKSKTLVFDNASGDFGAYMKNTFTAAETKADSAKTITFTNGNGNIVVLDSVSTWTLDKDVSLVWGCTGSCDLANDTLILKDYEVASGSPATLFDLGANALTGWGSQTVVFGGNEATLSGGEYTWGGYRLYKDNNAIKLAMIA